MRPQTKEMILVITLAVLGLFMCSSVAAAPLIDSKESSISSSSEEDESGETNGTTKNLYVIKAVVYEIGILTEADEDESSLETHERVDLTFFDAHTNESHIDLGKIPLPVQTNISGQVLTGISPVEIGAFSHPSELLQTLPLTGTIVNITHSDTAFFQLSARNHTDKNDEPIFEPNDLSKISGILEMLPQLPNKPESEPITTDEPKLNNLI